MNHQTKTEQTTELPSKKRSIREEATMREWPPRFEPVPPAPEPPTVPAKPDVTGEE